MSPLCLPTSFSLIQITLREQMSFQDFQAGHHGSHLRYWNGTNLAILNLYVVQMPPTKFWLNPTNFFGSRRGLKIFKMATIAAILESEPNDFSNSESLFCSDASHQASALSNLRFGRCRLNIFKMTDMTAILNIGTE